MNNIGDFIPVFFGVLSVAVAWGLMKSDLKNTKEELRATKEALDSHKLSTKAEVKELNDRITELNQNQNAIFTEVRELRSEVLTNLEFIKEKLKS